MIRCIDEGTMDRAIDFTWQICQKREMTSYPIKKLKLDLAQAFMEAFNHPDDKVLGYFEDDTLIASVHVYVEQQENYLRVMTYIERVFDHVMEELVSYLKERYPTFKVHFCYPKENTTAINYFEKMNYECIEASHDLRLAVKEGCYRDEEKPYISRVTKNEFASYGAFHDKHAGEDMYWNSSRLYEAFDSWYIYLYTQNAHIQGSIMLCKAGANAIEIFGLFVEEVANQSEVLKELLAHAIHKVLEVEQGIEQVIFFVEEQDTMQYELAKQIGFEDKGGFRCYSMDL